MGTFKANFTTFAFTGDGMTHGVGTYFYQNPGVGVTQQGQISWFLTGNCFFLDGSLIGIDFNGLPAGFRLINPLSLTSLSGSTSSVFGQITNNNFASGNIAYGTYSKSGQTDFSVGTTVFTLNANDISFNTPFDLLAFLFTGMLAQEVITTTVSSSILDNIRVNGSYDIVAGGFTVDAGPYNKGDEVTIDGTQNLDGVTSVTLGFDNNQTVVITDFISQSATQLVFRIPLTFSFDGPVYLIGLGNGIQFSGSVLLGAITVLIEDGSGVYEIVRGKTNDTIYVNSTTGPTTQDVAIPNPFGHMGFIGA